MKVILIEDVEKLGQTHDVVDVADGYARNFLFPRQMAIPANKSALANLDNMKRVEDRRQERQRGAAEELAGKLAGVTVKIAANAGTGGRLYGSINAADIAQQLQQDFEVAIDRKQVVLPETIREAGLYSVTLNLHRDIKPAITVQVGEGDFAPLESAANEAEATTTEVPADAATSAETETAVAA